MREVDILEAKNTLGSLLDLVAQGQEIVITRNGKPVARLVPTVGEVDLSLAHLASERIRLRAQSLTLGEFDWETLKTDRDCGRP